jgi:hypothetical protein
MVRRNARDQIGAVGLEVPDEWKLPSNIAEGHQPQDGDEKQPDTISLPSVPPVEQAHRRDHRDEQSKTERTGSQEITSQRGEIADPVVPRGSSVSKGTENRPDPEGVDGDDHARKEGERRPERSVCPSRAEDQVQADGDVEQDEG